MATKVFISWSGDLSNKLADAVREWLPNVLQSVKPYFTPSDTEKGAKWTSDISRELKNSDIGIICLTKENLAEPWILFEAGSLSKNLDSSKVCTLLFGVDSTDLKGPLTTFQATSFKKNDFKKLVKSINNSGGDSKLDDPILDQVFDKWWNELDLKIKDILSNHSNTNDAEHRSERDILEEILELSRLNVTGRQSKIHDLPPSVLSNLIEAIVELQDIVEIEGSKKTYMVLKRLESSMEYLFMKLDYPEIYNRYRMKSRRLFSHRINKDKYNEEKS